MAGGNPKTVTQRSVPARAGEAEVGVRSERAAVPVPSGDGADVDGVRSESTAGGPESNRDLLGGIRDGGRGVAEGVAACAGSGRVGGASAGGDSVGRAWSGVARRSLKATGCVCRRVGCSHGGVVTASGFAWTLRGTGAGVVLDSIKLGRRST